MSLPNSLATTHQQSNSGSIFVSQYCKIQRPYGVKLQSQIFRLTLNVSPWNMHSLNFRIWQGRFHYQQPTLFIFSYRIFKYSKNSPHTETLYFTELWSKHITWVTSTVIGAKNRKKKLRKNLTTKLSQTFYIAKYNNWIHFTLPNTITEKQQIISIITYELQRQNLAQDTCTHCRPIILFCVWVKMSSQIISICYLWCHVLSLNRIELL